MAESDTEQARYNMVEQQVRPWEVLDYRVLDVLRRVPREAYVPEPYRGCAYADIQIPLPHGQVMMEPRVEARLLQALDLQPNTSVLEIGTGTGYLSACIAGLAARITSVELFEDLRDLARSNLEAQGVRSIALETGDAAHGWDDGQRYDAIAVTASLPELHEGFHRSLAIGGRLFLIVGEFPIMEALLITRVADEQWTTESLFDTSQPALVGAPRARHFEL